MPLLMWRETYAYYIHFLKIGFAEVHISYLIVSCFASLVVENQMFVYMSL